jgi:hypothetical protein
VWPLGQSVEDPVLEWLSRAGSLGILAAAVVAFLRGWIVPGSVAEQLRLERDRALELVYKQAEVAQRALEAAERRR